MKAASLALAFLFIATIPAFAGPKEDFAALQLQRKAAIDQATRAIDARYVARLAPLEQSAAQQKDYALAAKIGEEIKAHTTAPIQSVEQDTQAMKALRGWLITSDWTWVDLYAKGHPRYHFWFKPNGNGLKTDGTTWAPSSHGFDSWKVVSPDEFYLENTDPYDGSFRLYFKVNRATKTVTLDRERSAKGHLDKQILYGNQTHNKNNPDSDGDSTYFGKHQ